MSQDPGINAAILNYMAKIGGDARGADGQQASAPAVTHSNTDFEWLRQAMAAVESPERKLKKMLTFVAAYSAEVFEKGPAVTGPVVASAGQHASSAPAPTPPEVRVEMVPDEGEGSAPADPPPRPAASANSVEAKIFADADEKNDFLLETLEELSDMVEDINWAAEFALMNGPAIVLRFLRHICDATAASLQHRTRPPTDGSDDTAAVRGEAFAAFAPVLGETEALLCMVVAHAAQLNEKVQSEFLTHKWHEVVPRVLELEGEKGAWGCEDGEERENTAEAAPSFMKPSAQVVAAGLHACSSLCRDSPTNTLVFLNNGGMALLISLLRFSHGTATAATAASTPRARPNFLSDKILARAFFFAAYLAESGLSAEELIELICMHTEAPQRGSGSGDSPSTSYETTYPESGVDEEGETGAVDEAVERAAAAALLSMALKSPKVVKAKTKSLMPRRLKAWAAEVNDTEDPRRRLVDELAKTG